MKHIGEEIHLIAERKGLIKRDLARSLGISASRFQNLREQRSIGADLLDRISKVLGVHPGYFFDDDATPASYHIGDINNTTGVGDATVNVGKQNPSEAALREIIAEKERTIRILMKQLGISDDVTK